MDFFSVLISMITLFVIMGIGYFLRKHGALDGNRVHLISHVLVNIAIPALTIMSMQMPNTLQMVGMVDRTLLIAFAYYLLAFVASLGICRFLPSGRRPGYSGSCWSSRMSGSWESPSQKRSLGPVRSFT